MPYWGLEGQRSDHRVGHSLILGARMKPWDLKGHQTIGGFKAIWKRDLEWHSCVCLLVSQRGERSCVLMMG